MGSTLAANNEDLQTSMRVFISGAGGEIIPAEENVVLPGRNQMCINDRHMLH